MAKVLLKRPSDKNAGELLNLVRNQLKNEGGAAKGSCHLQGQLFKLGLVDSPRQMQTDMCSF